MLADPFQPSECFSLSDSGDYRSNCGSRFLDLVVNVNAVVLRYPLECTYCRYPARKDLDSTSSDCAIQGISSKGNPTLSLYNTPYWNASYPLALSLPALLSLVSPFFALPFPAPPCLSLLHKALLRFSSVRVSCNLIHLLENV